MGYRRYHSAPRPARWMSLKYAGTCSVCGQALAVGARAWYSPADRTVTCTDLACAKARGLTKTVWHGAPTSGRWVDVLDEQGYTFRDIDRPAFVRDPGEDAADRWNEQYS